MVIKIQSGSSFSGQTSQMTRVWQISFRLCKGIGTVDTFCAGLGASAEALPESAKFVCIRLIPSFLVPGVTEEEQY